MADRTYNPMQNLEQEVKELYYKGTISYVAATATADLTNDIIFTSVAKGPSRNTTTFTIQVAAAAANPTNTVLAVFTGTSAAIVCTITPNNGTNNSATPVNLTTANLVELINSGSVTGKTVTVTDSSSLRALQTASGGGAQNLADGGEGDGVVATFSGGSLSVSKDSGYGFQSVSWSATGTFDVILEDKYYALKSAKGLFYSSSAADIRYQLKSQSITSKLLSFLSLTGSSATNPPDGSSFMLKIDVKNATGLF